jgi:hypothetical protein
VIEHGWHALRREVGRAATEDLTLSWVDERRPR